MIDLLELYKLNVLHLHLTDDQAWPLALGRPAASPEPGAPFYRDEDLRDLVGYAADRFVTIVPEIDTPGHTAALLRLRPDLRSGRNEVEYEFLPGHRRRAVWLDPELPATFELMEQVLAGVAAIFPGPYLHIGADEPRGMPDEVYASYVRRLRRLVRVARQAPAGLAGVGAGRPGPGRRHPALADRHRPSGVGVAAGPGAGGGGGGPVAPRRRDGGGGVGTGDRLTAGPLLSRRPLRRAARRRWAGRHWARPTPRRRTGTAASACGSTRPRPSPSRSGGSPPIRSGPAGPRRSPASRPRSGPKPSPASTTCPSSCCPAWPASPTGPGASRTASGWAGHRDRLARHGRLWAQDGLTYFRASTVDWT